MVSPAKAKYMDNYRRDNSDKISKQARDHRQQRIQNGLCNVCGNVNDNLPHTKCVHCKQNRTEYILNHIAQRIESKVCIQCGGIKEDDKRHCTFCNIKRNELNKLSREKDPNRYKAYSDKHSKNLNHRWRVLNTNARSRDLEVGITKEEYLTECKSGQLSTCHYCNGENHTLGLDRVDNTKGYHWDNVIPCCTVCNKLKLQHTQYDFAKKIEEIYNHWAKTFNPKNITTLKDLNQKMGVKVDGK